MLISFDGGGYEGEVAIFSLEGMEEFAPGSEEFIAEAASRSLSNSELGYVVISDSLEGARFEGDLGEDNRNTGEYLGLKTVKMKPGDEFGIMLVPNQSVQYVLENPDADGTARPLFSMATANPDDGFHIGQVADVTGDGSTFVMEDLRVDGRSDRDYNDIIFQVKGAFGKAELLDNLIDEDLDWRDTELGQQLLHYAIPEVIDPVEDVTLTGETPQVTIDLNSVFNDPEGQKLTYEVVSGNGESLVASLEENLLSLVAQEKTGVNTVAIRAIDPDGNSIVHNWQT